MTWQLAIIITVALLLVLLLRKTRTSRIYYLHTVHADGHRSTYRDAQIAWRVFCLTAARRSPSRRVWLESIRVNQEEYYGG